MSLIIAPIVLLGGIVLAGCGQETVSEFKEALALLDENPRALDGILSCDITFCRKVGSKTGKRIGIGEEFKMIGKSRVNALVDFDNVEPGKVYVVHLVWLRPDKHELFRKYVEVSVEPAEGGYRSVVHWRKTDDINYVKEEIQEGPEPAFMLRSRLNTSLGKERVPGTYTFRVYLHRELMLEKTFELTI